jgi:hypothetical protein
MPGSEDARVGWGPLDAIAGVLAVALALIFGGGLVVALAGEDGLDSVLGLQAVLELALIGVAVGFAARRGTLPAAEALGFRRPRSDRSWLKLTLLGFGAYLACALALALIAGEPEQTDVADELGFDEGLGTAVVAGALIVLVAPFCEEVFFRGFFFAGLRRRLPFGAAALGSGLLFGLIHLGDANLIAGAQLAILGVILAWLYEETDSLWAPIALHCFNNALAFTILVAT